MNLTDIKKFVIPHVVAIAIFLVSVIGFFHPVFFESKSIQQRDILEAEGAAKELINFRDQTGQEGLWTNSMFGGMPGYLINVQWSNEILIQLQAALTLWLPHPVRLIFMALISFYVMLLVFGVRPMFAIAGSIAFAYSTYLLVGIMAGHNSRVGTIALIPLVVAGIQLCMSGKRLAGFSITALALSMLLRINHLQIAYYLLLIMLIYGIVWVIEYWRQNQLPDFLKSTAVLVLSAALAIGTFSGALWAILEYSPYSMRGRSELKATVEEGENPSGLKKEYAFRFSNGHFEGLTLLIPNFFGGSTQQELSPNSHLGKILKSKGMGAGNIKRQLQQVPTYWGDQPLTIPYYAGAIVLFLFVLGLQIVERKYVLWLGIASVLGLLLAMGKNLEWFNYFLFDYLPGYNKFRSVTFALIISIFSIIFLGMLALERIFSQGFTRKNIKSFFVSFGSVGGICLLSFLLAGIEDYKAPIDEVIGAPDWFISAIRQDRASLLRSDALRSFFLILLAGGAIYASQKKKLNQNLAIGIVMVLIAFDSISVGSRFFGSKNFAKSPQQNFFQVTEADQLIKQDSDPHYRVVNLEGTFMEARTSYYHSSIGGYHGAKIRRYQDVVENVLIEELAKVIENLQAGTTNFSDLVVLNMLNVKYIVFGESSDQVVRNQSDLGNAWFISKPLLVDSPDQELERLATIDPGREVVIDQELFQISNTTPGASGRIQLQEYQPNYIKYTSSNSEAGLAVFSEIYYPTGWISKIDGVEVPHLRCNYILRGMEIPAGDHVIEFSFEPMPYFIGDKVMFFSCLLLLVVLIGSLSWHVFAFTKGMRNTNPLRNGK